MDGNIIHANKFAFDLQRFELNNNLDGALFSCQVNGELKYGHSTSDFDTTSLGTATEITLLNDVNTTDLTYTNSSANQPTPVLTLSSDCTLDLKGHTLTFNKPIGIQVADGKTLTLNNTGDSANGKIVNNWNPLTKDTIEFSNGENDINYASKNKCYAAINVGTMYGNVSNVVPTTAGSSRASLVMKGGTIDSQGTAICTSTGSISIMDGCTVKSDKSCGVYFGHKGTGGGSLTMTGGTITSGKNSEMPAIQVSGNIKETTTHGATNVIINISGGTVEYTNKNPTLNDNDEPAGDPTAIYSSGIANITISGDAKVTSTGTGVEFRRGELTVSGNASIESTASNYAAVKEIDKKNTESGKSSGSSTFGAALAVFQKDASDNTTVNVTGEEVNVKGHVALVVGTATNISGDDNKPSITVENATLESTAKGASAVAAQNADSRSTITIKDATLKGKAVTIAETSSTSTNTPTIKIEGEVTIVQTDDAGKVVSTTKYDASTSMLQYVDAQGNTTAVPEGWYSLFANQWNYFVKSADNETKAESVASLQAARSGDSISTTTLELTTGTADSVLPLDMTSDTFKNVKFTILDASKVTATNNFKLNITGNDYTKTIIGGDGNDTIKAIHSVGVFLNGGAGNDYLIGGDGKDTFAFSDGSDTIEGYVYGTDAISLGTGYALPEVFASINNSDSSNFVLAVGTGASLTFRPATALTISLSSGTGTDTFSYTAGTIAKNANISLGALYTNKNYDGRELTYQVIDASQVTTTSGINLRANDKASSLIGASMGGALYGGADADILKAGGGNTTLNGGAGSDSLVGGNGADVFIYDGNAGGTDTVSDYETGDLVNVRNVRLSDAEFKSATADDKINISLEFGGGDNLIFQNVGDKVVSVKSGSSYYLYNKNYYAHNKGITLAAGYDDETGKNYKTFDGAAEGNTTYETINAAAVNSAISIVGNTLDNYIVGGLSGNSLYGGDGDDTLVGGTVSTVADLFYYTAGKDVIENFGASDKLDISAEQVGKITSGKLTNSRLTFTVDKKNDLTFKFGDNDPFGKVSLQGTGYLTKDGVVSVTGATGTPNTLKLFGSAKGRIDLNDELYSIAGASAIATVDASTVKSQSVTLVGGTQAGTFAYMENNKQRDGFEYGGGSATITGYEGGRDRIDLNGASLTSFAVSNDDVVLNIGNGTGSISITDAKGEEVLLRDAGSRGYKKMVFADTGVVQNKKSNPTMVTVSSGASNYSVIEKKTPTVKKIFVTDIDKATSIQAGDRVNTIIDASKAANTVSLSGGNKNDKLIGNTANADMFVYGAGKDVIQNFGGSDQISLTGSLNNSLESAKITASKKSIKFKFSNKNVLTIKSNDTMSGALTINDKEKIYFKNAIGDSTGSVSLTSGFSGTFRTQDSKRTALPTAKVVDGSNVEKNLTFVGSSANETLIGGNKKKTMFKGGGGADSLVGGDGGKDTFFYAKGNEGNATISKFEFGTDKIKVASGILGNVEQSGNTITFGMTKGKSTDAVVGSFTLNKKDGKNVAIKANNTLYWFADGTETLESGGNVSVGQLITSDTKISAPTGYDVIDLNYSTNLVKSGVAIKVTGAKPKTTT